jgi:hypothetical protein
MMRTKMTSAPCTVTPVNLGNSTKRIWDFPWSNLGFAHGRIPGSAEPCSEGNSLG